MVMTPNDADNPSEPAPEPVVTPHDDRPALSVHGAWALIVGLGLVIWLAACWHEQQLVPAGQENEQWYEQLVPAPRWRLLAIFMPAILGLMLQPMPGGAIVLSAVVLTAVTGALSMKTALAGYADPVVWMVLAAYFLSRAFIKTGLARRIALTFVRLLGNTTLGLSYALLATDTMLAALIPSNAARVGGVLLPITRSLAELYKSYPGKSAGLLGTFLMLTLYQGDIVACALFITGQASNPLAAEQAAKLTADVPGGPIQLTPATWAWYALAPALAGLLLVPALIYFWQRPEITRTPAAAEFARSELEQMGKMSRAERILLVVFAGVCGLWMVQGRDVELMKQGSSYTAMIALCGAGVLFLTGVLTWDDAVKEHGAWDVFIWYGGLVQLGSQLQEAGLTTQFAGWVAGHLEGLDRVVLFLIMLVIYFYAHYAFASITVHLLSMYPAFVGVLLQAGAEPALTVACFAYFANLSAGLTHYGTTPAPIVFSQGYVSQRTWWQVGFGMSLVNFGIWLTIGMAWWKLLGLW